MSGEAAATVAGRRATAMSGAPDELIILTVVGIVLLAVFVSPTRLYIVPFRPDGTYMSLFLLNVVDLVWFVIVAVLVLWARHVPLKPLLAVGVLFTVGAFALGKNATYAETSDLFLFNLRLLTGLVLGYVIARMRAAAGVLSAVYAAGSTVIAVSAAFLLLTGGLSYLFYAQIQRFGALGLAPNSAAAVAAAAFNMLPFLAQRRPWLLFLTPPLLFGIGSTGSRAGMLLALVGVFLWIRFLLRPSPFASRWAARLLALVFAGVGVWWVATFLRDIIAAGLLTSAVVRIAAIGTDFSWLYRFEVYDALGRFLVEHPTALILGVGGSNVAVEAVLNERLLLEAPHAHNILLQIVVASGLLGLAVWCWILLSLFARKRSGGATAALRVYGLTLLVAHAIDYSLWQEKFLLVFATLLGFFMAPASEPPIPHREPDVVVETR